MMGIPEETAQDTTPILAAEHEQDRIQALKAIMKEFLEKEFKEDEDDGGEYAVDEEEEEEQEEDSDETEEEGNADDMDSDEMSPEEISELKKEASGNGEEFSYGALRGGKFLAKPQTIHDLILDEDEEEEEEDVFGDEDENIDDQEDVSDEEEDDDHEIQAEEGENAMPEEEEVTQVQTDAQEESKIYPGLLRTGKFLPKPMTINELPENMLSDEDEWQYREKEEFDTASEQESEEEQEEEDEEMVPVDEVKAIVTDDVNMSLLTQNAKVLRSNRTLPSEIEIDDLAGQIQKFMSTAESA